MKRSTSERHRRSRRARKTPSRQLLSRQDWIAAAQAELIARGIGAVKVGRLARRLRVTRGSFYWHFSSQGELLHELLKSWEESNTEPFERVLSEERPNGLTELVSIVSLYVDEKDYSPAFDTAVRDWARISREAAQAVRQTDERRIELFHRIFVDMGFSEPEALVRARVFYFHQVGYYALAFKEDPLARRALLPTYIKVLAGGAAPA